MAKAQDSNPSRQIIGTQSTGIAWQHTNKDSMVAAPHATPLAHSGQAHTDKVQRCHKDVLLQHVCSLDDTLQQHFRASLNVGCIRQNARPDMYRFRLWQLGMQMHTAQQGTALRMISKAVGQMKILHSSSCWFRLPTLSAKTVR